MKLTCEDIEKMDEANIRKAMIGVLANILSNMGYRADVDGDSVHVYTHDFKRLAERIAEALRPLETSVFVVEEGKKVDVRIHCGESMAVIYIYNLGRNEREITVWKI